MSRFPATINPADAANVLAHSGAALGAWQLTPEEQQQLLAASKATPQPAPPQSAPNRFAGMPPSQAGGILDGSNPLDPLLYGQLSDQDHNDLLSAAGRTGTPSGLTSATGPTTPAANSSSPIELAQGINSPLDVGGMRDGPAIDADQQKIAALDALHKQITSGGSPAAAGAMSVPSSPTPDTTPPPTAKAAALETMIAAKQKQGQALDAASGTLGAIGPNSKPGDFANAVGQGNAAIQGAGGNVTKELGGNFGQGAAGVQQLSPADRLKLLAQGTQMNADVGQGTLAQPDMKNAAATQKIVGRGKSVTMQPGTPDMQPGGFVAGGPSGEFRTPALDEHSRKMLVMNNAQDAALARKSRLMGITPQELMDIQMQRQLLATPQSGAQGAQQGVPLALRLRNPEMAHQMAEEGILQQDAGARRTEADAKLTQEKNVAHGAWAQGLANALSQAKNSGRDVTDAERQFRANNPEPGIVNNPAGGAANVPANPAPALSLNPDQVSDQIRQVLTPAAPGQPFTSKQAETAMGILGPMADVAPELVKGILARNPELRTHLDQIEHDNNSSQWSFFGNLNPFAHPSSSAGSAAMKSKVAMARKLRDLAGWPRPAESVNPETGNYWAPTTMY